MWTQGKKKVIKWSRGQVVEETKNLFARTLEPLNPRILRYLVIFAYCLVFTKSVLAEELNLQSLIDEALKNNYEILASESKALAYKFRIPQAKSLPDPMIMFGYENEGFRQLYNFSYPSESQWMFSVSQMFPFPGKLALKGEMASWDAESQKAFSEVIRLRTITRVRELYYELFLAYKSIDLIKDRTVLFSRIEDAATARYSAGMAPQQEVLMAQTEKYMLLEKEKMLGQKIQSIEAMLNTTIGRDVNSPLGRPAELSYTIFPQNMEGLINTAYANSPEIRGKEKMVRGAEAKVQMAKREYYPDFTINGSYFLRVRGMPDMWSLTTTINIPIFYKTKQEQAVNEAGASLSESFISMKKFLSRMP